MFHSFDCKRVQARDEASLVQPRSSLAKFGRSRLLFVATLSLSLTLAVSALMLNKHMPHPSPELGEGKSQNEASILNPSNLPSFRSRLLQRRPPGVFTRGSSSSPLPPWSQRSVLPMPVAKLLGLLRPGIGGWGRVLAVVVAGLVFFLEIGREEARPIRLKKKNTIHTGRRYLARPI